MAPSPTVDTVVFDMGGVLLEWDPRHLYRKVFDSDEAIERFLDDLAIIEWHTANHDSGLVPMADSVAAKIELHPEYASELGVWADRYNEMIGGPVEGAIEILSELRGQVALYLLSNAPAEPVAQLRADWPFLDWFDGAVISGEEQLAKPDPLIFQLLIDRYDLDPSSTVFIDDIERNLVGAAETGLQTILFTSAPQLRRDLTGLGLLESRSRPRGR
jgi:2-haloacid dehalogenase